MGYYSGHKEKLLKDFDRTSVLMKDALVAHYGKSEASSLQRGAREEYEQLIPRIPFIEGPRARMLNSFLLITAQELAVWKAMKQQGRPPGEAWEVCHEALRMRIAEVPQWKRWLLRRIMFSHLLKRIMARRAQQQVKNRFGDFEIEYLSGDGEDFDFGVNYLQCGNLNFARKHGGEEFAPYICMSDIALSEALGWGLIRTQTLADGCDYCDFRFKKGAATRISSKTPDVQDVIEKIRSREIKEGAAVSG